MESTYCLEGNNPIMYSPNLDTYETHFKINVKFEKKEQNIWTIILSIMGLIFGIIMAIISLITLILCPPIGLAATIASITATYLIIVCSVFLLILAIADLIEAFTRVNFIKKGLGISTSTYNKIKVGLTVAIIVLSIASMFLPRAQCFKEGTPIQTKEGLKPIEEIKEGDLVLSYDETTGKQALKKVVRLFRNEPSTKSGGTMAWVHITINGEEICSTPGHKYYLPYNKEKRSLNEKLEHTSYEGLGVQWVNAEHLKQGDIILLASGEYGTIDNVFVEHLDEPETTYNFEVEDYHTYYVGTSGTLVHNAGGPCGGDYLHNGNEVYRGGDFEAANVKGHYKLDPNGNVLPARGLSVNYNPADIPSRFADNINKITSMPNGLTLVGGQHILK